MVSRETENQTGIHSALFVDFDNIYISLADQDEYVAKQFATYPEKWLAWLEQEMPRDHVDTATSYLRILVRRCYLNPQSFARYRPFFIRAAFEVVDCPPLTTRGKTSSDIHMVMDILDALNHSTTFREFIILSGDSDFTPVLLRLRKHDRFSVVLSAGYVSPAYRASCDHIVSLERFIQGGLGISEQAEDTGVPVPTEELHEALSDLLGQMAGRLYEAAIIPDGIEASELPSIYREFPEFSQSEHWLGFYSLRSLTEGIVSKHENLVLVENDPWRVARAEQAPEVSLKAPLPPAQKPGTVVAADHESLMESIGGWIRTVVNESTVAVPMAALAQGMAKRFGQQIPDTGWLGAGSFKDLLVELQLGGLEISSATPGFVYDPARHSIPVAAAGHDEEHYAPSAEDLDPFTLRYAELAALARQVHQLTDTPYLMPEHYALLLQELAREVNERGYHMTRTSKTVRDRCVERGAPIARSHVNFVLIGLGYMGHRFGQDLPERPEVLGEALVQNTINLCRRAQLELDPEDTTRIREWILGGLGA